MKFGEEGEEGSNWHGLLGLRQKSGEEKGRERIKGRQCLGQAKVITGKRTENHRECDRSCDGGHLGE